MGRRNATEPRLTVIDGGAVQTSFEFLGRALDPPRSIPIARTPVRYEQLNSIACGTPVCPGVGVRSTPAELRPWLISSVVEMGLIP